MSKKSFAKVLREIRLRVGLSQAELGQRVGLTGSYISQLESGQRRPLIGRRVQTLCQALGVAPDELQEAAELERSSPIVRRKIEAMQRERHKVHRARHRFIAQILFHIAHDQEGEHADLSPIPKAQHGMVRKLIRRAGDMDNMKQIERELSLLFEGIAARESERLMHSLPIVFQRTRKTTAPPASTSSSPPETADTRMFPIRENFVDDLPDAPIPWHATHESTLDPANARIPLSELAFWFRVADDDAYPRYFKNDLVLLDPKHQASDGDWCVLSSGRSFHVRLLRQHGAQVSAESIRPDMAPIRLDSFRPEHALTILALVRIDP